MKKVILFLSINLIGFSLYGMNIKGVIWTPGLTAENIAESYTIDDLAHTKGIIEDQLLKTRGITQDQIIFMNKRLALIEDAIKIVRNKPTMPQAKKSKRTITINDIETYINSKGMKGKRIPDSLVEAYMRNKKITYGDNYHPLAFPYFQLKQYRAHGINWFSQPTAEYLASIYTLRHLQSAKDSEIRHLQNPKETQDSINWSNRKIQILDKAIAILQEIEAEDYDLDPALRKDLMLSGYIKDGV